MKDPLPPYEDIEVKLTALLLGELGEEEVRELEARLADDPALQALHLELKASVELMKEAAQVGLCATSVGEKSPLHLSEDRRQTLIESFRRADTQRIHSGAKVVRGIPWFVPMGIAAALIALMCVTSLLLNTKSVTRSLRTELASIERNRGVNEERGVMQTTELFSNAPVVVSSGTVRKEPATDHYFLTTPESALDLKSNFRSQQNLETLNRLAELPTTGPALQAADDTRSFRSRYAISTSESAPESALEQESLVDFESESSQADSRASKAVPRMKVKNEMPEIRSAVAAQSRNESPSASSFAYTVEPSAKAPMTSTSTLRPQLSGVSDSISLERQGASPFGEQPEAEVLAAGRRRSVDLFVSGVADLAKEESTVWFDETQGITPDSSTPWFENSQKWGFQTDLQAEEGTGELESESRTVDRSLGSVSKGFAQNSSFGIELADAPASGYSVMQRSVDHGLVVEESLLQMKDAASRWDPAFETADANQETSNLNGELSVSSRNEALTAGYSDGNINAPAQNIRGNSLSHFDVPTQEGTSLDIGQGGYKSHENFSISGPVGGISGQDFSRAMAGGRMGGGGTAGGGGGLGLGAMYESYGNVENVGRASGLVSRYGRALNRELKPSPDSELTAADKLVVDKFNEPTLNFGGVVNDSVAENDGLAVDVDFLPAIAETRIAAVQLQNLGELDADTNRGELILAEKQRFLGEREVLNETAEYLAFNKEIAPTPTQRGGVITPEEDQEQILGRRLDLSGTSPTKDSLSSKADEIDLKKAKADDGLEQLYGSSLPPAPNAKPLSYKPDDTAMPVLGKKFSSAKPQPGTNVEHRPEQDAKEEPISTFSLNVSDVSFKLAQAALDQGQLPDPESIRSEQFLNAFDFRDPAPYPGQEIGFNWEVARHPFAHHRDVLRLALKTAATGREAGRPMSLTLLLDNSGSMERSDRREILRQALDVLSQTLSAQDKISVVSFARTARLWVDGVPGGSPGSVLEPVQKLVPQGGTNLEEALNVAYEVAQNHYMEDGMNRVILLTDGAANLGNVDPETLKQKVEAERRRGVAFDCFGIGWDGLNDPMLESLSRNGEGRYAFLNDPTIAGHEFADRLAGALNVAASDVKVQVEFNTDRVGNWRQVGYAKHQLTKEQFRDNTVDAAEIAASEAGNALYVIEPKEDGAGPIGVVRVRFREPHTNQYHEKEWTVPYRRSIPEAGESSPSMKLAMTSSLFAEWLNGNPHAGNISIRDLKNLLGGVPEIYGKDPRPQTLERMLEQARRISGL